MAVFTVLYFLGNLFLSQPETSGPSLKIKSVGLPLITSYTSQDYDMANQNLDVLYASDNRVYFGNNEGVLIYDGLNWTQVRLTNESDVYGLEEDQNGRIYVGGVSELGYLTTSPNGEVIYQSLMGQLAGDSLGSFATFPVFDGKDRMIFRCSKKTVIVNTNRLSTEVIDNPFSAKPHVTRGTLFATTQDSLYELVDQKWISRRKSKLGSKPVGVSVLVDLENGQTIAVTQNGFYDFESEEELPISKNLTTFLSNSFIYRVDLIANKYLVLSTWNGLLIVNLQGEIIMHLQEEKGLSNNFVFATTLDESGMLWIATNNGIDRIDIFSPYSLFDERIGVRGVITSATAFEDQFYFGSISGIFVEQLDTLNHPLSMPHFKKLSEVVSHGHIQNNEAVIFLTEIQPNVYVKDGQLTEIEGTEGFSNWRGIFHGDDAILGNLRGQLTHLEKVNARWRVKARFDPSITSIHHMSKGNEYNLWVINTNEGVYKLEYDMDKSELLSEKKYGVVDGLPSNLNNCVFTVNNKPFFTTEKGVYKYQTETDSFIPDEKYASTIGKAAITLLDQDENGVIYYYADHLYQLTPTNELRQLPDLNFKKYVPQDIEVVSSEDIIISTLGAVVHLNPNYLAYESSFNVKITNMASLQHLDSSFYAGFGPISKDLIFDHTNNDLRIQFVADYFKNESETMYQWRLLGDNEEWSDWSKNNTKEYTNLPHGQFTFEVRARNCLGKVSETEKISFEIATPIYFAPWAYALYAMISAGFVWGVVLLNTRRLRLQNLKLEKKIEERTEKIRMQHNKLLEMDDLKKRFFVNISHELRTPLTLSMGTINQALKGVYGAINDELYANLKVSKENNERLLKMVNNILDISKLESGKIQLYASLVDPKLLTQKVLVFFTSRMAEKRITLHEDLEEGLELYLDQDKFETILINLVSNAFKFTPEGGEIYVQLKEEAQGVFLTVKDSGEGIPKSDLSLVFDRFYQSKTNKSGEGIGVGLALTKELVELHHGSIEVKNDNGAVFTLVFQKGRAHFSPNQIVEEPQQTTYSLADKYVIRDDPKQNEGVEVIDEAHGSHILLVEDNPEMRQFVGKILSVNYKVSMVEDGQKGLEFLKKEQPDLIVTDYLMPNMNGYEMATEIKKSEDLASIPIVFLTARAREQDKINVLNLGVDDYLFKPFNPEELLVRIKNLLAQKKQRSSFVLQESIDPRDIEWKEFPSKLKFDIDAYIKEHIKEEISGEALSAYIGQSERSLYRKIKVNTGLSVMQYIKEYRLRHARTLLENKEMKTVSEVSYAVGFNYLSHFTKNYKERFGKQPSEYLN